jgi:hypothetical protein
MMEDKERKELWDEMDYPASALFLGITDRPVKPTPSIVFNDDTLRDEDFRDRFLYALWYAGIVERG